MIEVLLQAISEKYSSNTQLKNALTGGLWFTQAPEENAMPYAVMYYIGDSNFELMGGVNDREITVEIQVNIFSDKTDGGFELLRLIRFFKEAFDWQILNIAGYKCIKVQNTVNTGINYIDEIWQTNLVYEIGLIKE